MNNLFKKITKFLQANYLLILITGLGSLLFFYNLGQESFWGDEAHSYFFTNSLRSLIRAFIEGETNMWIYYISLHLWLKFGDSETYIRSLSVLFACISIPGIYWLGCVFANRKVGLIATILFVTHIFIITYAQEARGYSVFICFTIYSSIFYLKSLKENTLNNWLLYIFFTTCVIYSHVFSIYFLFVQAILTIRINKKISINRNYIFSFSIIFLLSLPLISLILLTVKKTTSIIYVLPPPTFKSVLDVLYHLAFESWPLVLLSFSLIIYGAVTLWREFKSAKKINFGYIYFICAFVTPIIIVFLIGLTIKSVFVPRYFIFTIPPFLLLVSYGIYKIQKKPVGYFILGLMILLNIYQFRNYYLLKQKDQWRELVSTLFEKTRKGDSVFINPAFTEITIDYYSRHSNLLTEKNVKVLKTIAPIKENSNEIFSNSNLTLITNTAKKNKRVLLITSSDQIDKERFRQNLKIKEIFEKYLDNKQTYTLGPTLKLYIYE